MTRTPSPQEVTELQGRLLEEAQAGGYHLNPDEDLTKGLVEALLVNTARYGYPSCPCRLASGVREEDLDILCPCDYRDPDLAEYGCCYCALYVSGEITRGEAEAGPIPERRPAQRKAPDTETRGHGDAGPSAGSGQGGQAMTGLAFPVWRCPVCGYLCAREHPPEKCPICKADRDRFQKFL